MPIEKIIPEQIEQCKITSSIASQNRIGWQHFILGRLTLSYLPIVKKLNQQYTATRWMKGITLMLLDLYTVDWRNYC